MYKKQKTGRFCSALSKEFLFQQLLVRAALVIYVLSRLCYCDYPKKYIVKET